MSDIEKLPVKGPGDVIPEIPYVKPDIHTVDVPNAPDIFAGVNITWGELFWSSLNSYARRYVVDTVSGKVVSSKILFWVGCAVGVVGILLIEFLVWQMMRAF